MQTDIQWDLKESDSHPNLGTKMVKALIKRECNLFPEKKYTMGGGKIS